MRKRMMMYLTVFYLFMMIIGGGIVHADIIYVKYDAVGTETGRSWIQATSMQTAITNSVSNDEIWVAAGTYKPTFNTDTSDTRSATFQLKNNVGIYGGFNGTETERTLRDWQKNITILSGDIGTAGNNSDNAYRVVTGSKTDSTAILDGFTITKGNADGASTGGGGIYIYSGSPTVNNCIFKENTAVIGGGMYNHKSSSPYVTDCSFISNKAAYGGGMCNNHYSSPVIENCTFSSNTADDGGGMRNDNFSKPQINTSTFNSNKATYYGGGIYNTTFSNPTVEQSAFISNTANMGAGISNSKDGMATVVNCTFSGNAASDSGGGMYNSKESESTAISEITVTNCTFHNNIADNDNSGFGNGGGIYVEGDYTLLSIRNTVIAGNNTKKSSPSPDDCYNDNGVIESLGYNIVEFPDSNDFDHTGDITGKQENLNLSAIADNGGYTKTCRIKLGSPAINAVADGNAPQTDQRGYARNGLPDIGAFEYKEPAVQTLNIAAIGDQTATVNGNVTSDGGFSVTARGVCWSKTTAPTIIANPFTKDGEGKGNFTGSLSGLTPGTTYYVRAYSTNQEGMNYGNELSFKTIPAPPVATAASKITASEFTANWKSVTGADDYRLDVSETEDFSIYVSGYQHKTIMETSDSITGLSPGTTYYYRIRAYNSSGYSGYSNIIILITIPGKPEAIAATDVKSSGFTANWKAASGAESYRLDVSTSIDFTSYVPGYQNKSVSDLKDTVTGLTPITTYYYRVRAVNVNGTGENSDIIKVTTAPEAPNISSATSLTNTGFKANWSALTGITSYLLDVSLSEAFDSFVEGYNSLEVLSGAGYNVTDLTGGTLYYYRVRAVNSDGISNYSAVQSVKTLSDAPKAISPENITSTGFTANWEPVTGAEKYSLDISTANTFDSPVPGYADKDVGNVTHFDIINLKPGTLYYYRIRAVNSGGTSVNSNIVQVITIPASPNALDPDEFTSNGFTARWDAVDGAETYYLDVSSTNDFTSFIPGYNNLNVGNKTSQKVVGVQSGTTCYYRIRAYNSSGTSQNSNIVIGYTLPPVPDVAPATDITETGFTANWGTVTGADSYLFDLSMNINFSGYVTGYQDKSVNGNSLNIAGLTDGTLYYYRVRAVNSISGAGGYSNSMLTWTLPPAPKANPATDITYNRFTAHWEAVSVADSYLLDVSAGNDFGVFVPGYEKLSAGKNISQQVIGLNSGTTYYYRVYAVKGGSISNASEIIECRTVLSAPVAKEASDITESRFTANWETNSGAERYYLDISTSNTFSSYVPGYQNLNIGNTASYQVINLSGGTVYYYRVRAENASGMSSDSNVITVKTVPSAPSVKAASDITPVSFIANWEPATVAVSYLLDISPSDIFGAFVPGYQDLNVGNTTGYSVTGLTACLTYYYRVRTVSQNGISGYSAVQSVLLTGTPTVTTDSVSGITQNTASCGGVISDSCGSQVTERGICLNTASLPTIQNNHTSEGGGTGTFTSQMTGLKAGTKYYVRAYGINSGGIAYGNEVSFTTLSSVGDIDGNQIIDLRDAIICLKVLAGIDTGDPVITGADVNNDGKIGLEEAAFIIRVVTGN